MAVKSAGPRVGVRPVRWGLIGIYRSTLGIKQSVGSQPNIRLKKPNIRLKPYTLFISKICTVQWKYIPRPACFGTKFLS